jgi:glutamyl-tRNA reductase
MKPETEILAGVSVSHGQATVDQIETAASASEREAVESLLDHPDVTEAFVLQTCNRAEAYVVSETANGARAALSAYLDGVDRGVVRDLDHRESLRHLMAVACGLESLVVGEDQIIGQVRDAYDRARDAGGVGPTLDDALLKALHVGERARSETKINEGALSIGSAAVRFAASECDLDGATALVVGAGEMATLAAEALDDRIDRIDRILIANRTLSRAERLADGLETESAAVDTDALSAAASESELVISATGSPDHVLEPSTLETAGETCVIDVARPRDVAPAVEGLCGVSVYDLDAIEAITDETRARRRRAAEAVESMIDEELERLLGQYKRKRADEVIAAMYEGAERIKGRELRTAVSKLESESEGGVSETEREILESMADALVGQLLSAPTRSLRDAAENDDWSTIRTALQLFGPGFEPDPDSERAGAPGEWGPNAIPAEMREQLLDDS